MFATGLETDTDQIDVQISITDTSEFGFTKTNVHESVSLFLQQISFFIIN